MSTRLTLFFKQYGVIFFIAYFALTTYLWMYDRYPHKWPIIQSDAEAYYAHLPSYLIFRDITYKELSTKIYNGRIHRIYSGHIHGVDRWPENENLFNKTSIGVAILIFPFFIFAHGITYLLSLPLNGYSFYYQHAVGFSTIFYTVLGCCFLRKLLSSMLSSWVVGLTLISIVCGTNLFYYTTMDSGFSHAYSFCLFSVFLFLIPKWYQSPSWKASFALGVVGGLIILIRNINLIMLLSFGLYGLFRPKDLLSRIKIFWRHRGKMLLMVSLPILLFVPQAFLWQAATGHWIINSYMSDSGFQFSDPKIISVLFSVRKGLFFWSPILLFGVWGLKSLFTYRNAYFLPAVVHIFLYVYMVSSWSEWWYGGSFGHRAFIDSFALFAIPMAFFFSTIRTSTGRLCLVVACAFFIFLSQFQGIQLCEDIIHGDNTTWKHYKNVFLKMGPLF